MNLLRSLLYTQRTKGDAGKAAAAVASFLGQARQSVWGGFGFREATNQGYKSIVWVNRCIEKIGETVSSVPWIVEELGGKEPKVLKDHPLGSLMNNPNPYMDRRQFYTTWVAHLSLGGNSYQEITFANKLPKYLYPIRPDYMTPKPDPRFYLRGYECEIPGQKTINFEVQQIMHYMYIDPLNEYVGVSPLTAAARTLQTENAVVTWNKAMLDNNAIPGGLLKINSQGLEKEDRDSIVDDLFEGFTGANRFRPIVLWGDMDWKAITLNQKEMDFGGQRNLNKYEICAALGVPPQMVGAQEDPKYNNYNTSRLSFWEDLIIPMLDWIMLRSNARLAAYWGPTIRVRYDISGIPAFRESFRALVEIAKDLHAMHYPINAINARLALGMPQVEWGDTAWIPQTLVPIGETPTALNTPEDQEPADDEDDEQDPNTIGEDDEDEENPPADPNEEE